MGMRAVTVGEQQMIRCECGADEESPAAFLSHSRLASAVDGSVHRPHRSTELHEDLSDVLEATVGSELAQRIRELPVQDLYRNGEAALNDRRLNDEEALSAWLEARAELERRLAGMDSQARALMDEFVPMSPVDLEALTPQQRNRAEEQLLLLLQREDL